MTRKILNLTILFMFVFLLVSCQSQTERKKGEWIKYRTDKGGSVILYNNDFIKNSKGDVIQVWNKRVFNNKTREEVIQERKNDGLPTTGYEKLDEDIFLVDVDCKNRKHRYLNHIELDSNRNILSSSTNSTDWEYTIPDSIMDELRKKVCK